MRSLKSTSWSSWIRNSLLAVLVLQPMAVLAEEAAKKAAPAAPKEEPGALSVIGDYLSDGGAVMYVILGLSILGTLIFFERMMDLHLRQKLNAEGFIAQIRAHVEAKNFQSALTLCTNGSKHPLVAVVRAGLLKANRREKEVEKAMEEEMLVALPRLQKRVGFMALLANTATLTGLLGTIFGLISAFNSVAMASAAERQTALAGGISQAMYTTAFGISVAVPLLFFHHFMSRRTEQITMEIESGATALVVAMGGARLESVPRKAA